MIKNKIILIAAMILLYACGSDYEIDINDDTVLANSGDYSLTMSELKKHLIELPINQRWNSDMDSQHWYEEQIESLMVQKIMLSEAKLIGYDQDPEYINKSRNLERWAYSTQYLNEFEPPQRPTESDLKRYYQNHLDEFVFPESRRVYHIYNANNNKPEITRQEMQNLRNRILQGENIQILAPEFSESETRHKQGLIGLVKKGDLSTDFDRVVFNLQRNQPSEVIKTSQGYHIFLVSDILPAQSYDFESVQNLIMKRLEGKHAIDFIQEKAKTVSEPEPFLVPNLEELAQLIREAKPQTELIQVGEYSMSLAELQNDLSQLKDSNGPNRDPELIHSMLKETAYRERIYQYMLSKQLALINPNALHKAKDQLLISEYRQTKLRAYVNQNPKLLNDYFTRNEMRFATPVLVQLSRLEIPFVKGENLMPELEKQISRLDKGLISIEELATEYNGTIKPLPMLNTQGIKRLDPLMLRFAFLLSVDEHAPPYRTANQYIILKLLKRKEAVTQPLIVVRKHVMNQFIQSNSSDLFSLVKSQMLKNLEFNESVLPHLHHGLQQ